MPHFEYSHLTISPCVEHTRYQEGVDVLELCFQRERNWKKCDDVSLVANFQKANDLCTRTYCEYLLHGVPGPLLVLG